MNKDRKIFSHHQYTFSALAMKDISQSAAHVTWLLVLCTVILHKMCTWSQETIFSSWHSVLTQVKYSAPLCVLGHTQVRKPDTAR